MKRWQRSMPVINKYHASNTKNLASVKGKRIRGIGLGAAWSTADELVKAGSKLLRACLAKCAGKAFASRNISSYLRTEATKNAASLMDIQTRSRLATLHKRAEARFL
jgi:hypothetical protein